MYFYLKATRIMFLALRELAFAKGRFSLMGAVIALIAILTVLLSGLSSGLVNDGVSGLKAMPVSAFAFDEGTKTDNAFSRSIIEDEQVTAWREDRKSTRLNSSHVSISYAVFCLKRKRNS